MPFLDSVAGMPEVDLGMSQDTSDLVRKGNKPVVQARYDSQFYKTKICTFWQKNSCKRKDSCKYAHGYQELKDVPNLSRTAMCSTMLTLGTCKERDCTFAHSIDELRATDNFYKTTMCCFHRYGTCSMGVYCRHAHSREELRANLDNMAKAQKAGKFGSKDQETSENGDGMPKVTSLQMHHLNSQNRMQPDHVFDNNSQGDADEDDDDDDDDLGPIPDWVRIQSMPAPRTAVPKWKSRQCNFVEANRWNNKDYGYADQSMACGQFNSEDSLPEMPQWARVTSMPAALQHPDGVSDSDSCGTTTCDSLNMTRQISERSHYDMSMTMSPPSPLSSAPSPCQWVNPQARKLAGLPDPITQLSPATETTGFAPCFAAGSMNAQQRATAPMAPYTPRLRMPFPVWNPMFQMGQRPLCLVVPVPASSLGSQEVSCDSVPVVAEGTCSSSLQEATPMVHRCNMPKGMIMTPELMSGAPSTNLPTGISDQGAFCTSSTGIAPGVSLPCGSNETMAALRVRQDWLKELEAKILQDAMPESYQD